MNKHIERIKNNREVRHKALQKTKLFQEREREIAEAAEFKVNSFWCERCQLDFDNTSRKMVHRAVGDFPRAWYESACPEGHRVILQITDKHLDPYYEQSRMLKEMRYAMRDELLTPADERFKYVYPSQWRKIKEEEEMQRAAAEQAELI